MAQMYLMCGLSGVGKTTFAKQFAKEKNLLYLGIDEFYAKINGDECIHENSFEVWIEFFKAIHEAEINKENCIIDTNALTRCHREQFLDWFPSFEHHLIYVSSSEELRYLNNSNRKRIVPPEVMERMRWNLIIPRDNGEDSRWITINHVENYMNKFTKMGRWR